MANFNKNAFEMNIIISKKYQIISLITYLLVDIAVILLIAPRIANYYMGAIGLVFIIVGTAIFGVGHGVVLALVNSLLMVVANLFIVPDMADVGAIFSGTLMYMLVSIGFGWMIYSIRTKNEKLRELTERVQQEKDNLRTIIKSIGEAIIIIDTHNTIIETNKLLEDLLGISQSDALGKDLSEVIAIKGDHIESSEKLIARIKETNEPLGIRDMVLLIDGNKKHIEGR
ncbi:MAG: PAS domain-containing protein [Firmicutes bacterium]|nr:PAS domain-containing protein [Bacillota bacterium]